MISTSFFDAQGIHWQPYDGELSEQPYIARYADSLGSGLSFDEVMYGKSAAKSLAKVGKWRLKRDVKRLSSSLFVSDSFDSINSHGFVPEHLRGEVSYRRQIDTIFSRPSDPFIEDSPHDIDVASKSFGSFSERIRRHNIAARLRPVMPYVTEVYKRVMAQKNYEKADGVLQDIERKLTLSGTPELGTLYLCDNEETLHNFAQKLSHYLCKLINDKSLTVHIYGDNCFSLPVMSVLSDYLHFSGSDVNQKVENYGYTPFCNRLFAHDFILRRLRVLKRLALADFFRESGFVYKAKEAFVGSVVVSDRKYQLQRNADTLDNMIVFDAKDPDNFHLLADIVSKSNNCSELRRKELIVRLKGFSEYGDEHGYQAAMLTFTTPSRFHAFDTKGRVNSKWLRADKPTVNDGADWLKYHWALIQARFAKADIRPFGFKFIEPHHDGTIHYHMVLWFKPEQQAELLRICETVMLMEREKGALKHRFHYTLEDKSKGSVIGYCIAYISKNINGFALKSHDELGAVDSDGNPLSADDVASACERVDAWKSAYRFRQFSQIGGPSVTAWREFRRMRNEFDEESPMFAHLTKAEHFALESLRIAAGAGDWKTFCLAMGGVTVKRKDQSVSVAYSIPEAIEKVSQALDAKLEKSYKQTRYGDPASARVMGLNFKFTRDFTSVNSAGGFSVKAHLQSLFILTRTTEWQLSDKQRFEQFKKQSMSYVDGVFDQLERMDEYERMQEEKYQQFLDRMDEQNSMFDRALTFEFDDLPPGFHPIIEDYFDSSVFSDVDFPLWNAGELVQGAALN